MTTPQMPPLVQTEAQKAYAAAALARIQNEKAARANFAERLLGVSLGGAVESRIQVKADLPDGRIAKIAAFARQHGLKVCVGGWSGLVSEAVSDADKQMEQIVLGFAYGVHITPEQIADYEKSAQS